MSFSQLEINKFSPEGELLRRIRCLVGRVSVFRSQSEGELEKFKKALEGRSQADRFSVLLDGAGFSPDKHIYVGFGPLDEAPSALSVTDYLLSKGVDTSSVEGTLVTFGLGGLSRAGCNTLEPSQWKMLRMTALCVAKSIDSIVILHEPFENIPEQYREVFADKIAKAAWEKNALVIITKLSYRPSVWIENDHIARVQLERPRQGTIGFGGGELSSAEAISNLRKELGITEQGAKGAAARGTDLLAAPARSLTQKFLPYVRSPIVAGALACFCVLIGATSYLMVMSKSNDPEVQTVKVNQNDQTGSGSQSQTVQSAQNGSNGAQASGSVKKPILDGYNPEIQLAWVAAIEDPASLFKKPAAPHTASEDGEQGSPSSESPIKALYKELSRQS